MSKKELHENSLDNLKLRWQHKETEALSRKAFALKLPPDLDEYVRSKPNKNQWLTAAVKAAVEAEKQSA